MNHGFMRAVRRDRRIDAPWQAAGESGRRMNICLDCGIINEPDTSRAILERLAPNADPALIEEFIDLAQRS
jgi:hypothetical protein